MNRVGWPALEIAPLLASKKTPVARGTAAGVDLLNGVEAASTLIPARGRITRCYVLSS
jgi:hypothetical protein